MNIIYHIICHFRIRKTQIKNPWAMPSLDEFYEIANLISCVFLQMFFLRVLKQLSLKIFKQGTGTVFSQGIGTVFPQDIQIPTPFFLPSDIIHRHSMSSKTVELNSSFHSLKSFAISFVNF